MTRTARLLALLAFAAGLSVASAGAQAQKTETVNCIVAVVGMRAISLTDVRIVEAFGVLDAGGEADPARKRRVLVDRLIDQKVVVDLARENISVEASRVEKAWTELLARLGRDEAKRRLEAFGAEPVDLLPYLEEKLLAEAVINKRFSRGAAVSIKEIEAYYAGTYAPARKSFGLPVSPLIDVADALENEIRRAKLAGQVELWIKNLRGQTEIEIRPDCLK